MAKKKKAKIASQKKKGLSTGRGCPVCETEMKMTRVMRFSDGPSGMLWVCTNNSCMAIVSKHGTHVGSLLEKAA